MNCGRPLCEGEGRDVVGESLLILPMDIFFRKPHLFDFVSSFCRGCVSFVYELSRSRFEWCEPIEGRATKPSGMGGRFLPLVSSAEISSQMVRSIVGLARMLLPGENEEDTPKLAKRFGNVWGSSASDVVASKLELEADVA